MEVSPDRKWRPAPSRSSASLPSRGCGLDDAALCGPVYRTVSTPLFFIETLADLEEEVAEGKTPEQVVGIVAAMTANLTSDPSAHHRRLVISDLLGGRMLMDGCPHVVGGRPVQPAGRKGVVFDEAPEAEALHRWREATSSNGRPGARHDAWR
jgi:hypothetical protein